MNRKNVNEYDSLYDNERLENSLLENDEYSINDPIISQGDSEQNDTRPPGKLNKPLSEWFAGGLAATSVCSCIVAIATMPNNIVIATGALACGLGPYGYYQQTRLTDIADLLETREKLENEVSELKDQNTRLYEEMQGLKETVDGLCEVEDAFNGITEIQGQSVVKLGEQVRENRKALDAIEVLHRTITLQNLLQIIVVSDNDGDSKIDRSELEVLIKRIQDINGVKLNEHRFRQAVLDSGGSLTEVMNVVKDAIIEDNNSSHLFSIGEF